MNNVILLNTPKAVILGLRKPWMKLASPLGFLRTRDHFLGGATGELLR
jgi:hypothetical protein